MLTHTGDKMTEWSLPHLKVILMGDSGVGKSSLMNRFVNHRFTKLFRATIGVDFLTRELSLNGRSVILQIWDTAGTERFQSVGTTLFRGAHGCILVFDVTSMASFAALDHWLHEFLTQASPVQPARFPFLVMGNKTDLENRQVTKGQAQQWCRAIGAEYMEGSAKEDVNVSKAFLHTARVALQYFEANAVAEKAEKLQVSVELSKTSPEERCQC